jgi:hypothetical protein
MSRSALVAAVATLALGIGGVFIPFLSKSRETFAGVPSPEPIPDRFADAELQPGSKMCLDSLALPPTMATVRVRIGTYLRSGQPLELVLDAPGYHQRRRVAGTYEDNDLVAFPVTPPEREVLATGCITNRGDRDVAVHSTNDINESARPSVTFNGTEIPIDPGIPLFEANRASVADHFDEAVERAALFRPFDTWAVWALIVLVVAAVLVLPLLAFLRAEDS